MKRLKVWVRNNFTWTKSHIEEVFINFTTYYWTFKHPTTIIFCGFLATDSGVWSRQSSDWCTIWNLICGAAVKLSGNLTTFTWVWARRPHCHDGFWALHHSTGTLWLFELSGSFIVSPSLCLKNLAPARQNGNRNPAAPPGNVIICRVGMEEGQFSYLNSSCAPK